MKTVSPHKIVFLIILLTFCNILEAQELQVNFCDKVQTITSQQAKNVEFFKNIPNFKEALLFQKNDSTYSLDIFYTVEGNTYKESREITKEEVEVICSQLTTAKKDEVDDQTDFGRDGRRRLLVSSMTYSMSYYGWAIPTALDFESEKAYTVSYLFSGAAGFFIPFLGTRDKEVTWGMARGYSMGSGLGIAHGWGLALLLEGKDIDGRFGLGLSVTTSLTEGLTLYYLAKKNNLNNSQMSLIGYGGIWGGLYGAATPYIFDSDNPRVYAFSSLLASGLGIYGGNYLSHKYPISNGDITIINTLGTIGAYLPLSVLISLNDDEMGKDEILSMMVGSMIGIGVGLNKTRNYDYSNQQGNIISLGSFAGYLTGMGFAYLADSETAGYMILSGLGAVTGFILTDNLVSDKKTRMKNKKSVSLKLDFYPTPLYGLLNKGNIIETKSNTGFENYFFNVRMLF